MTKNVVFLAVFEALSSVLLNWGQPVVKIASLMGKLKSAWVDKIGLVVKYVAARRGDLRTGTELGDRGCGAGGVLCGGRGAGARRDRAPPRGYWMHAGEHQGWGCHLSRRPRVRRTSVPPSSSGSDARLCAPSRSFSGSEVTVFLRRGAAAGAGMHEGDVIEQIDGHFVTPDMGEWFS